MKDNMNVICNEDDQEFFKEEFGHYDCEFCGKQLKEFKPKKFKCCDEMNIAIGDGMERCVSCGWFNYVFVLTYEEEIKNKRKPHSKFPRLFKMVKKKCPEMKREEILELLTLMFDLMCFLGWKSRSMKYMYVIRRLLKMRGGERYVFFDLPKFHLTTIKYEKMWNEGMFLLFLRIFFIIFLKPIVNYATIVDDEIVD